MSTPPAPPTPSALSALLSTQTLSNHLTPSEALSLEILHNLQHQHSWTSLRLHPQHHNYPNASWSNTSTPSPSLPEAEADSLKPSISHLDLTNPPLTSTSTSSTPPTQPTHTKNPVTSSSSLASGPIESEPRLHPGRAPLTLLSGIPPQPLYTHPDLQLQLLKARIGRDDDDDDDQNAEREWVVPTTLARKWSLSELCEVFDALPERAVQVIGGQRRRTRRRRGRGGRRGVSLWRLLRGAGGRAVSIYLYVYYVYVFGSGRREGERFREVSKEEAARGGEAGGRRGSSTRGEVRHQDAKRVLLAMRAHEGKGGDGTVVYYIVQEGEVKPRQN
ncbi:hypothetical protein GJ744_010192 [Endocarpon pusillum]|uniref:tRNA-splicing endonuclease subunit Sen15 domain-containing protein n=1 Tax=Endocarpon pusillum TaxID=364733 RepID=A0A8H7E205_9EURO|nr:hypothetical protein GJ744_010192 [Endocarpon pusillum]